MANINSFLLTDKVTVGQTRNWIKTKDENSKERLIELINHRFYNRYVKHLKEIDSGFLKMAISCLMIETLESFRQGKKNTKAKGVGLKMFIDFFKKESALFPGFEQIAKDFYINVRCGILHQAETTNAWRILRTNVLLDKKNKTINATKFVSALGKALNNYVEELKSSELSSPIWKNAILKLEDICDNCKIRS